MRSKTIAALMLAAMLFPAGCRQTPKESETRLPGKTVELNNLDALNIPAQPKPEPQPETSQPPSELETKWGVRIVGISPSSAGYMLDFRYRVIDPFKAGYVLDRKNKPYLIDEATGSKYMVPTPPKVGPLRQTTRKAEADTVYYVFFVNPGKTIKQGDKVSVIIGDFKAEHLVVQ